MSTCNGGIGEGDYAIALRTARREFIRLGIVSIGGMEPHDIAVEAVILSQRWGGSTYIRRRAKLLVIEKLRHETGMRLVSKTRARIVQTESFNGFESKRITDISHEDLEELLATIKIPELLKDMIRMKVHFQFSNQQVASFFGMSESRTSQYIGYWSHHILEVMKERSIKSGINWVKNIKPRAIPQCMNKNKNKSKDLSLAH
jgi:hypothetical protein